MVVKSWESEDSQLLEELARKQREKEIVEGVIRSVRKMKLPLRIDGENKTIEGPTLIVALPGGVTGYCPVSLLQKRELRYVDQVVSQKAEFVITRLDLDHQVAILSGIEADNIRNEEFWSLVELADGMGKLKETKFKGRITGYNQNDGIIYVRVSGQDTYMYVSEWSWQERVVVDAQVGETIDVVVLLYNKDEQIVRVSRKQATSDPYKYLYDLQPNQTLAGKVVNVHPIHGIFVEVETDVHLKGFKLSHLEEPDVGDIVRCSVRSVEPDKRRGRVLIVGYPNGKRTKKDLGSFLFE